MAMSQLLLIKALGFGLIWLSFVLVLAAMLISQRREDRIGQPYQHVITLAVAAIGLCAMIGLGLIAAKTQGQQTIRSSFDQG